MKPLTDGEKDISLEEKREAQDYREAEYGEEELDEDYPEDYWQEWDTREAWRRELELIAYAPLTSVLDPAEEPF
jgi:hypothetical protein